MATSTLLTIDDFERLPPEILENHELVNGELVPVSKNTPEHIDLSGYLYELLRPFFRKQKLGKVYTELLYDFSGNAHAPDVSFLITEKMPLLNRQKHVQRFVPDLAIEIASPSDTLGGLLRKKDRYLGAGTKEVWIISPETHEVLVYPQGRSFRGSDELSTPLIPGFSITVERLFADAEA